MAAQMPPAGLEAENRRLRLLLCSAVDLILAVTDCVEYGDPPEGTDLHIAVPFGHLEALRDAANGWASLAGLETD